MDRLHPPASLVAGLSHLVRSYRYARDTGVDPWQFAVELELLFEDGVTLTDLRWLLAKGYIQHQQEVTPPGAAQRQFRVLPVTQWPASACVLLTASGYLDLTTLLERWPMQESPLPPAAGAGGPSTAVVPAARPVATPTVARSTAARPVPEWDPTLRELRFRGQVIKRFRVPAPNQELVLNAFQAEGWPEWIEDPHPHVEGVDPVQRLLASVKSLNRNQLSTGMAFHCQSSAGIVSWSDVNCSATVR
jgi:hypothetical protein